MKYKICEYVDGNGRKFYRIKYKGFLGFWFYVREYGWFDEVGTVVEKSCFEDAKKIVNDLKEEDQRNERNFKSCVRIQ